MTRLPETVTTKFTELFDALHSAADDLRLAGTEAHFIDDFSQVAKLNKTVTSISLIART